MFWLGFWVCFSGGFQVTWDWRGTKREVIRYCSIYYEIVENGTVSSGYAYVFSSWNQYCMYDVWDTRLNTRLNTKYAMNKVNQSTLDKTQTLNLRS